MRTSWYHSILSSGWKHLLWRGIAAIAFGVFTWIRPDISLAALVTVFAIYALFDGVLASWIAVRARVSYTFPLRMAEIVWGNGTDTQRKIIPLDETHEFGWGVLEGTFPVRAAAFVREARLPPELYNDVAAGGYLAR